MCRALDIEAKSSEALFWRNMYHELHAHTQQLLNHPSSFNARHPDSQGFGVPANTSLGPLSPARLVHEKLSNGVEDMPAPPTPYRGMQPKQREAHQLPDDGSVADLHREIVSLRWTLQAVQEAKVDIASAWDAPTRIQTRIDHACAALESKQSQMHDLHSQLSALRASVSEGMEQDAAHVQRQMEKEKEREKYKQREKEKLERVGKQRESQRAAAEAETHILKTLATDKITFEANAAEMTDKGKELVSKVSLAIRGLGSMPVEIHGHCKCDCGNMDLSRARAQALADKLQEEGCTSEFIIIPHADGHPEIGAQMLVRIIPKPDGEFLPITGDR